MSKELIERLRADAEATDDIGLCADAAERIEELERKVASRDAEVAELKKEVEEDSALRERLAKILAEVAIALKGQEGALTRHSWHDLAQCAIGVVKERDQLREQLAELNRKLNEPVLLSDWQQLEKERDQLREQVRLLRDEVIRCRDWFETQAKVTSKGGPSSWELMLLRDERDAADEALAATEPKP